jgi:signal transduction histidine kinase
LGPFQEIRAILERAAKRLEGRDNDTKELVESAAGALDKVRTSLLGMRLLFGSDRKPLKNEFRHTDVLRIIKHWVNIYSDQIEKKNLEVIIEPNQGQWMLFIISSAFDLLFRNLLDNAIKYSFDASAYSKKGKLIIKFDSNSGSFSVINFGVGIPRKEIESGALFKISQRGERADDRGRIGKGVGLYLVDLIAKQHQAKIVVTSDIQNPEGNQKFYRNEFCVKFPHN